MLLLFRVFAGSVARARNQMASAQFISEPCLLDSFHRIDLSISTINEKVVAMQQAVRP
jgi:hypothetical protein